MSRETPLRLLTICTVVVFSVFLIRLWQLQILKGEQYLKQSLRNRVRVFRISAPRGIIYDRKGVKLVKNVPYYIASILPDVSEAEIDIKGLSELLDMSEEEIRKKIKRKRRKRLEPIRLKGGLDFEDVARIEARRSDFPGLIIETEISRYYNFGKTAAHVVGYLGKPTKEQLSMEDFRNLPEDTMVGRWGAEAMFDKQLRGKAGMKFVEVDALGRQLRTLRIIPPEKGEDLYLSIDIDTQIVAEKAFQRRSGALLALEPSSGEVIALVSLPSFDPNMFIKGIEPKQWLKLTRHPGHPLINRVFQSQYPPGSVFKLITAIAAMEEGLVNKNFKVNCKGFIEVGQWRFRCWKDRGHGIVDMKRAIVESCDVYFYELGRITGIDRIAKYAYALGLGRQPGLGLSPEKKGLIPTTTWKLKTRGRPWYLGETFNAAIGQGYVSVSPAQAALLISAIANGGTVYRLQLLKNAEPEIISRLVMRPETIKIMKEALYGVVNQEGGTGLRAHSDYFSIAGKTGTAQVVGFFRNKKGLPTDHAWFVAYAPSGKPKIALSVFVEHGGHGGEAAAPIAKEVIETYLSGRDKNEDNKES
jgi:penicillin-binding protein 2